MDGWLQALFLGVLQGLTEFLPVSSSGHLVLAQLWLGDAFVFMHEAVLFDLVLHVGTLIPVLYFYRADLAKIVRGAVSEVPWKHSGGWGSWLRADDHRWLAFLVCVAMVPTGLMGIGLKDVFESLFHDAQMVSMALLITGGILFSTRFFQKSNKSIAQLSLGIALAIGIAQGFAITPGISRSGSTIAMALVLGLERDLAARFSFLLSIPAILGALVLMLKDGVHFEASMILPIALGFVSALVAGYFALWMLVALVRRGGIHKFAYYLWPVGILALILTR